MELEKIYGLAMRMAEAMAEEQDDRVRGMLIAAYFLVGENGRDLVYSAALGCEQLREQRELEESAEGTEEES